MMGPKRQSEIKRELRQRIGKSDKELLAWFNQEMADAEERPRLGETGLETLQLLRDALLKKYKKPRPSATRKKAGIRRVTKK
jgi:hypothetical protein